MPIDYGFFYYVLTGLKYTADFKKDVGILLGTDGKLQKLLDHKIEVESDMLSILCKDEDDLIDYFINTLNFGRDKAQENDIEILTIGKLYDLLDDRYSEGE
jgi:hypothetical protein